ncbi:MAG: TadE/TadG family type IV pilus assembly protein, partial [Methyloligellaceae bacterium]
MRNWIIPNFGRLKDAWAKSRFRRNTSGIAAVEFAMIVPLMVALYMGAVEFGQVLAVDRRVSTVASATADLVAQADEISTSDITDIFAISSSILKPYSGSSLKIVITSVVADEDNKTTVDWSEAYNGGSAKTEGADYTLPSTNMTQAFGSIIVAEVEYTY